MACAHGKANGRRKARPGKDAQDFRLVDGSVEGAKVVGGWRAWCSERRLLVASHVIDVRCRSGNGNEKKRVLAWRAASCGA
jgi:hypothetical protein